MNLDQALRLWLASPTQVQDWSEVDPKLLRSKDIKVVSAEYAKVKTVDGPPHYTVPDGWEIESIALEHEPYWFNEESGTGWPESLTLVVTRVKTGPTGQKHRRKDQIAAEPSNPIEFMEELFRLTD